MHKLLLVDDEQFILNSLERMLEGEPYTIYKALNTDEAMQIVSENDIDIILCDESMPGTTGSVFITMVNRYKPSIVSMILTGRPSMFSMKYAVNEGNAYRYLLKPISCEHLKDNLEKATTMRDMLKREEAGFISTDGEMLAAINDLNADKLLGVKCRETKIVNSVEFINTLSLEQIQSGDKLMERVSTLFMEVNRLEMSSFCSNVDDLHKLVADIHGILQDFKELKPTEQAVKALKDELNEINNHQALGNAQNILPVLYILEEQISNWAMNVFVYIQAEDINYAADDIKNTAAQLNIRSFI